MILKTLRKIQSFRSTLSSLSSLISRKTYFDQDWQYRKLKMYDAGVPQGSLGPLLLMNNVTTIFEVAKLRLTIWRFSTVFDRFLNLSSVIMMLFLDGVFVTVYLSMSASVMLLCSIDYGVIGHFWLWDWCDAVYVIRDCGVFLDCALDFRYHVESVVSKAYSMSSFHQLEGFHECLLCSYLEYASVVWFPGHLYVEVD